MADDIEHQSTCPPQVRLEDTLLASPFTPATTSATEGPTPDTQSVSMSLPGQREDQRNLDRNDLPQVPPHEAENDELYRREDGNDLGIVQQSPRPRRNQPPWRAPNPPLVGDPTSFRTFTSLDEFRRYETGAGAQDRQMLLPARFSNPSRADREHALEHNTYGSDGFQPFSLHREPPAPQFLQPPLFLPTAPGPAVARSRLPDSRAYGDPTASHAADDADNEDSDHDDTPPSSGNDTNGHGADSSDDTAGNDTPESLSPPEQGPPSQIHTKQPSPLLGGSSRASDWNKTSLSQLRPAQRAEVGTELLLRQLGLQPHLPTFDSSDTVAYIRRRIISYVKDATHWRLGYRHTLSHRCVAPSAVLFGAIGTGRPSSSPLPQAGPSEYIGSDGFVIPVPVPGPYFIESGLAPVET